MLSGYSLRSAPRFGSVGADVQAVPNTQNRKPHRVGISGQTDDLKNGTPSERPPPACLE